MSASTAELTLELPAELWARVRAEARAAGVWPDAYIGDALAVFVDHLEAPPVDLAGAAPWSFTERLATYTVAGRHRTRTRTYRSCPCDRCGEVMRLPADRVGITCRMTPGCEGHHRRADTLDRSAPPAGGPA